MHELPPVIDILLQELASSGAGRRQEYSRSDYTDLVEELRRQARWTEKHYFYSDETDAPVRSDGFSMSAAGTLNPLATMGKCLTPDCRAKSAEAFARSVCLYSDVVYLEDTLTPLLASDAGEWSDQDHRSFVSNLSVLRVLGPLISNGMIKFSSGMIRQCQSCYGKFENEVEGLVLRLCEDLLLEVNVELSAGDVVIDAGEVLGPTVFRSTHSATELFGADKPEQRELDSYVEERLSDLVWDQVEDALISARVASKLAALAGASTSAQALALHSAEGIPIDSASGTNGWADSMHAKLPWLDRLTAQQVIELKHEAPEALAILREKLASCNSTTKPEGRQLGDLVSELRIQAEELRAAFSSLQVRDARRRLHKVASTSTLTFTLLGVATGSVGAGAGIAGLMGILGLLHSSLSSYEQELSSLKMKPAYALFKARELQCVT